MAKSWTGWNMSATNNTGAKPDHVRFGSEADDRQLTNQRPLGANSGHDQASRHQSGARSR